MQHDLADDLDLTDDRADDLAVEITDKDQIRPFARPAQTAPWRDTQKS